MAKTGTRNYLICYRASVQESTSGSPFFLMHGRDPQSCAMYSTTDWPWQLQRCSCCSTWECLGGSPRSSDDGTEVPEDNVWWPSKNKLENECSFICQLLMQPKVTNLWDHFMDHIALQLYMKLEFKSDQSTDLRRILSVWHFECEDFTETWVRTGTCNNRTSC